MASITLKVARPTLTKAGWRCRIQSYVDDANQGTRSYVEVKSITQFKACCQAVARETQRLRKAHGKQGNVHVITNYPLFDATCRGRNRLTDASEIAIFNTMALQLKHLSNTVPPKDGGPFTPGVMSMSLAEPVAKPVPQPEPEPELAPDPEPAAVLVVPKGKRPRRADKAAAAAA